MISLVGRAVTRQDLQSLASLRDPEECREAFRILQAHLMLLRRQSAHFGTAPAHYARVLRSLLMAAHHLEEATIALEVPGDHTLMGIRVAVNAAIPQIHGLLAECELYLAHSA